MGLWNTVIQTRREVGTKVPDTTRPPIRGKRALGKRKTTAFSIRETLCSQKPMLVGETAQ